MRRGLRLLAALAMTLVAVSIAPAPALAESVQLDDVMQGDVDGLSVDLTGNGGYFGGSISATFDNQTGQTYDVVNPVGLKLAPSDPAYQTMLTCGGPEPVVVPPGTSESEFIAFCGEYHDEIPDRSVTFEDDGYVSGAVLRTLEAVDDRGDWWSITAPNAIWFHTDNLESDDPYVLDLAGARSIGTDDAAKGGMIAAIIAGIAGIGANALSGAASAAGAGLSGTGSSAAAGATTVGAPPTPEGYMDAIADLGVKSEEPGMPTEVRGGVLEHLDSGGATAPGETDPYAPGGSETDGAGATDDVGASADAAADDGGASQMPADGSEPWGEADAAEGQATAGGKLDIETLKNMDPEDAAKYLETLPKAESEALLKTMMGEAIDEYVDEAASGQASGPSEALLKHAAAMKDMSNEQAQTYISKLPDDERAEVLAALDAAAKQSDAEGAKPGEWKPDIDPKAVEESTKKVMDPDSIGYEYKPGSSAEQPAAPAKPAEVFDPAKNAYTIPGSNIWYQKLPDGSKVLTYGDKWHDPLQQPGIPDFDVTEGPYNLSSDDGKMSLLHKGSGGRTTGISYTPGEDGIGVMSGDADDSTLFTRIKDEYSLTRKIGQQDEPTEVFKASYTKGSGDGSISHADAGSAVGLSKEGGTYQLTWDSSRGQSAFERSLALNTDTGEGAIVWGDVFLSNQNEQFTAGWGGNRMLTIEEGGSGFMYTMPHSKDYTVTFGLGDDHRGILMGTAPASVKGKPLDISLMINKGMRATANQDMMPELSPMWQQEEYWTNITHRDSGWGLQVSHSDVDTKAFLTFKAK